jgi:hypothetical protein
MGFKLSLIAPVPWNRYYRCWSSVVISVKYMQSPKLISCHCDALTKDGNVCMVTSNSKRKDITDLQVGASVASVIKLTDTR